MFFISLIFIILAAIAPGLAWLIFFLREDVHPEPRKFIAYTFGMGGILSVPIVVIQVLGRGVIFSFFPSVVVMILFLALIEELFKLLAVYFSVGNTSALSEPVDFMIYMIVASLGLATVENFFILSDFLSSFGVETMKRAGDVMALRFVGATFLHALASGIVGFYWAKYRIESTKKYLFFGIVFATLLHSAFNYLVITFQESNFLIYPSILLIFASVFLFKDFEKLRSASRKDVEV
ncbi:MAG: PrsW family intramembrane metalloprotease [Candidatus Magasanikbacteria bacterium]